MIKNAKLMTKNQKTAQTILLFLSVTAVLAGVAAVADIIDTPNEILVVETWRMVGLFTFAALFALLADKMQTNRDLWMVVIGNKVALTVAGGLFLLQGGVDGAKDLLLFDGAITVLLFVAAWQAGVLKHIYKKAE